MLFHGCSRRRSYMFRSFCSFCLLLLLHAVYGCYRLIAHLLRRTATVNARDLQLHSKNWSKLPAHLAVSFRPTRRRQYAQSDALRVADMLADARLLVDWCCAVGVQRLSLFDEQGSHCLRTSAIAREYSGQQRQDYCNSMQKLYTEN